MPDVLGTGTAVGAGRTFAGGSFTYGWSTKAVISVARFGTRAAEISSIIYLPGGFNASSTVQSRCDAYDYSTNSWTQKASMPATRSYAQVAAYDGKLYVMGGYLNNPGTALTTTYEYDPVANTWSTKAVMPRGRAQGCAAVLNGKIYLFGGATGSTANITAVDEYDPATDTWATKAGVFPTARILCDAVDGGDGYIYVGGGLTSGSAASALMHRYDPVADTFTSRTSLTSARSGHGFSRRSTLIYSTGGVISGGYSTSHIAYDVVANSWTAKTSMTNARYLLATSSGPGGIFAMGGYNGSGLDYNEHFRAPELEGQGTATGRGVTIPYPVGNGTAVGEGVMVDGSEVEFSGRTVSIGFIPLEPVS